MHAQLGWERVVSLGVYQDLYGSHINQFGGAIVAGLNDLEVEAGTKKNSFNR